PHRIALGGVDHPPAGFVEPVEDGEAGVLVGGEAEHVAAEDQRDADDGGMVPLVLSLSKGHRNFSCTASSAIAASAAPQPLSRCFGSARTSAWASFSTVRMPLPTAIPSRVSAMSPRADSLATISK